MKRINNSFVALLTILTLCFSLSCFQQEVNANDGISKITEYQTSTLHPATFHHPGRFKTVDGYHYLIELKDLSVWRVHPSDSKILKDWRKCHQLVLKPIHSSFWSDSFIKYNYELHNIDQDCSIAVCLKEVDSEALHIDEIDRNNSMIRLNDNSLWQIEDQTKIDSWIIGHRIVIGVCGDTSEAFPGQILINADIHSFPYTSAIFLKK